MPRARRHFIPGYIWHITHRCHKREFLLKFAKDRQRWMHWLFEAKKRYGLAVLNFMITSNHIHLLVADDDLKMELLNIQTVERLKKSHNGWIEEALRSGRNVRESKWVQNVAVGSKEFVEMTKKNLGYQVKGRSVSRSGEVYQLREQQVAYSAHLAPENVPLSDDNAYYWNISDLI